LFSQIHYLRFLPLHLSPLLWSWWLLEETCWFVFHGICFFMLIFTHLGLFLVWGFNPLSFLLGISHKLFKAGLWYIFLSPEWWCVMCSQISDFNTEVTGCSFLLHPGRRSLVARASQVINYSLEISVNFNEVQSLLLLQYI
jgi:hypothetical protein